MDDACAWSTGRQAPVIKESTNVVQQVIVENGSNMIKERRLQDASMQQADIGEKTEVTDIGWNLTSEAISEPWINNIPNNKIWTLIRRFNKDVSHVRKLSTIPPDVLDLEDKVEAENFRPERLALNLQRVYLTVVLGIASFRKHIARLRSWREKRRTLSFLLVYSVAWTFDFLAPAIVVAVMVIVASEQTRKCLFPPLPRSIVDTCTGGLKRPEAGELGTFDTLTGAPESSVGDAVDKEASNFVANLGHIVLRAVGMHDGDEQGTEPVEGKVPRFVRSAVKAVKPKESAPGHATCHGDDRAQKPMEDIIWSKAKPEEIWPYIVAVPDTMGELVDNWERVANLISPTPPLSRLSFIRLYVVFLPVLAVSLLISPYLAWKATGFLIGFGMFGKPILTSGLLWVDQHYSRWRDVLRPKHFIFKGVPTNAQLTLALLRLGEEHAAPLPPISSSHSSSSKHVPFTKTCESTLPVTKEDLDKIVQPAPAKSSNDSESHSACGAPSSGADCRSRLPSILNAAVKSGIKGKLRFNYILARLGSRKAQGQVGVIVNAQNITYSGPSMFSARYEGRSGWIHFAGSQNGPLLVFGVQKPTQMPERENTGLTFSMPVNHICELKRAHTTLTQPFEKAARHFLEKEVLEGLEIVDGKGKTWILTALPQRNELFNRLVSIGSQRWVKV